MQIINGGTTCLVRPDVFRGQPGFPPRCPARKHRLIVAATGHGVDGMTTCLDCAIIRHPPRTPLAPARRRRLTLQFAMQAATRLNRFEMPQVEHAVKTALRVE